MSGELLDLDAVARPDKTVELTDPDSGKKVRYRLPGDPPSGLVVRMDMLNRALDDVREQAAEASTPDEVQALSDRSGDLSDQMRELVLEIFQIRQPTLDMDFIDKLSYDQLGTVFYFTLGLYHQAAPDPPKPQRPQTRSPKNSPRSGSSGGRASRSST